MNAIPNMILQATPEAIIRFARPADKDQIMANLRVMGLENSYVSVNYGKVRKVVDQCLEDCSVFVVEKNGKVVGAAGLYLSQFWCSDQDILGAYFFFVHPAHREYRIANALLTECERAAKSIGVPLVIGVMSKKDALRKYGFFARRMKPAGGLFVTPMTD